MFVNNYESMKFKKDEFGMIYAEDKKSGNYYKLFHRLNFGEYEVYYKNKDGMVILDKNEMKDLKRFLEGV